MRHTDTIGGDKPQIRPQIGRHDNDIARLLARWYQQNARQLPWRIPSIDHAKGVRADPYHVWLCEVMLQQTQVATVGGYFEKFLTRWPDIAALAKSQELDVLRAWAGLGYYSRARNLKKCADEIVRNHAGIFPRTANELKQLPGIGEYTAAAIAAIAFDQPVAVIDGNVERVMARLFLINTPFPGARTRVRQLLYQILDATRPGEFAQAMMDLGAMICTPKKPKCGDCPVSGVCLGYIAGVADELPRKTPKPARPLRSGAAFVIERRDGAIYLCRRGAAGLLAGMSEVPGTGWSHKQDGAIGMAAAPFAAKWQLKGHVRHSFTHFHLELEVWHTKRDHVPLQQGWWCTRDALANEALPVLIRKVIKAGC